MTGGPRCLHQWTPRDSDWKRQGHQRSRPAPAQLNVPAIVFGKVIDNEGNPAGNATVRMFYQDEAVSSANARPDGSYSMGLRTSHETFDIQAGAGDLGAWALGVTAARGNAKKPTLRSRPRQAWLAK